MNEPKVSPILLEARTEFEDLIKDIRPELHRYVARMVGSVIDGEDVVQETLAKAYYALPTIAPEANLRGWLFRIAHNKAIDFLRGRKNQVFESLDEFPMPAPPDFPLEKKELAAIAMSVFLELAVRQRSAVILKDVLDYSLAEISEILNATVPEIKAVLHRGRTRLRELAASAEPKIKPVLSEEKRELLNRYVELFNQHDFDGVRDLLAEEVRLDLVGRLKQTGAAEIRNNYFRKYDAKTDWRFAVGAVEDNPAILVYNSQKESPEPYYFITLELKDNKVINIRDYRYASYVIKDAKISDG
jgi:RNA polymerase sigma-70 factor, ECF subfamily